MNGYTIRTVERVLAEAGRPLTVREVGELAGIRSPSTVHKYLAALIEEGHVRHVQGYELVRR